MKNGLPAVTAGMRTWQACPISEKLHFHGTERFGKRVPTVREVNEFTETKVIFKTVFVHAFCTDRTLGKVFNSSFFMCVFDHEHADAISSFLCWSKCIKYSCNRKRKGHRWIFLANLSFGPMLREMKTQVRKPSAAGVLNDNRFAIDTSAVAKRATFIKHDIDWDNLKVTQKEQRRHNRKVKEAVLINCRKPAINKVVGLH